MTLGTERIRTLDQLRAFLEGNEAADFHLADRDSGYAFVRRTLVRFQYHHGLGRPDKGRVWEFLGKVTGLSPSQLSRLIAQHRRTGHIRDHRKKPPARPFTHRYTRAAIALLAEVDGACGHPSGPAFKEVLRRQREVFGDTRFERLATISNGHIYNLRAARRGEAALMPTTAHCQLHYTLSNVEFTHDPLHLGARDPEDEGEFGVVDRDEPA